MAHHKAHEHPQVTLHHEPKSFWTRYIFSQDAKIIGIQYLITALLMGFVGMALSWLMRLQLGFPGKTFPWLGKLMPGGFPEGTMSQMYLRSQ